MTNRPSEDELLAYLEGESSPDESAAVRAAMEADPRLRAWIEAAARDRALTQMWGDLAAARTPGGMVEDAMALVERRALLDSESNQHKATGRSWRPHLAAAAVLLLAGGSAVILAPQIFGPGPASTQMAAAPESEDPADEAGTAKESARQELATADGADTQRRSAATSQPLAPKAVVGDATRLRGPQTTRSAALADDAAEPEAAAAPVEITDEQIEEAYALLRERRLALALTIASDADESAITSNVAQSLGAESVEVPMTREAAASLLRAAAAHAVAIRIESLDEPVEIAGDASPHDLSWWHQPADRWSPRSVVPLTFERAAP